MADFESAYQKVSGLVREFEANESYYVSAKYQESEVRTDFIDKFWIALGWDVRHKFQTNPREQEVKVERNPDSSASNRKADYAFYLKPQYRDPAFFVEAKKPSRKLADTENYFQTVRYGYNASTPVAILMDFEEFHIIDCRYEPNREKSFPSAQIKTFHYKDYLDREKFGEIYWLFSHEALETGKLKEFVKELPKQRGKGKQKLTAGELRPVDEGFLIKLEEYRLTLAKAFKKADESLTAEVLTEATQKVIDRLVFIRFLEDKAIESDYIVDQFAAKKGGAWKSFVAWSKELDVKYNGVVFKAHDIDKPSFKAPDDEVFRELCEDISHTHSHYLFSLIPIEILGSIYERFLGKVVTATAKRADIEEKPEVRKAGGVYYTPKYIVDYIVANTVGKLIEGKTPKEIAKLRFADIACGSGSFLIAVYDTVLHYVEKYYNEHKDEAAKAGCVEIDKGVYSLSLKQKQRILLDNIFGVDIDRQAVEVAQLSLFLKLLENESGTGTGQLTFEKTKILPDLSKNIVNGNSLVEYDISDLFPLSPEDEARIKPFDFRSAFKEVMAGGGFDAIVGNPPYVRIQILKEYSKQVVDYFKSRYKTAASGNYDIYVLFVEKGLRLLKQTGRFGYILPIKFTTADYGASLRQLITDGGNLNEILSFGHGQVFIGATTYTCILILTKTTNTSVSVDVVKDLFEFQKTLTGQFNTISAESFGKSSWYLGSGSGSSLFKKLTSEHPPLGLISDIYVGLQTSADDVFILDLVADKGNTLVLNSKILKREFSVEADLFHPLVSGTDVKRYGVLVKRQYILFPYQIQNQKAALIDISEIKAKYPKTFEYLFENKKRLEEREHGKMVGGNWYGYIYLKNMTRQSVKKLCVPRLVSQLGASFDRHGDFFLDNVDVGGLTMKEEYQHLSLEYIMALVNSKLLNWYFPQVSTPFRGGWYSANKQYLSLLPIKDLNSDDNQKQNSIIKLVDQMLETKKRLAATQRESEREQLERKCDHLDHEIDRLVYELYGLTEEEIRIVEGE